VSLAELKEYILIKNMQHIACGLSKKKIISINFSRGDDRDSCSNVVDTANSRDYLEENQRSHTKLRITGH